MFDPQYDVYQTAQKTKNSRQQPHVDLHITALRLYQGMLYRGRIGHFINRILRREHGLIDLKATLRYRRMWSYSEDGIQPVALHSILGSEGRAQDFDRFFRPINEATRQQWLAIAMHMIGGVVLPAVELVEVGGIYFVRDGHLRVSVARALGLASIKAQVVHLRVDQPVLRKANVATRPVLELVTG